MIAFAGQQAGQVGQAGQDKTGQDKIGQDRTEQGGKGRALLLLLTKTRDPERCR